VIALRKLDADRQGEERDDPPGVEGNRRLTTMLGGLLLLLLAIEGGTIPDLSQLEVVHVVVGLVLIPAVLLKLGTTFYRFARYYTHQPAYRRAGPPHPVMRLLGPLVVLLTISLFASGVALVIAGRNANTIYAVHKASFILWFGAMTIHVVGHLWSIPTAGVRDWRSQDRISGSGLRRLVVIGAAATGVVLAVIVYPLLPAWGHG
jgi:hypothetical protein